MPYPQSVVLVDTPSLVLSFDETRQCLQAEWKGQHDVVSVLAGCAAMRQCLTQMPCDKILDDSSQADSDWEEVADWVSQHFFSIIARHGIRYYAWIGSSDATIRRSMELAVQHCPQPKVALFDDAAAASAWLEAQA